jgi:DNA-binding MarR family transcriptional regulator
MPTPALQFLRRMWVVNNALESLSSAMLAKLGVTGPQRLVVRTIGTLGQVSAGQLARELRLHPSTLTGLLQRLEARGFVVRTRDPDDARRILLTLAESGRTLDTLKGGTVEAAMERAVASLSPEEGAVVQRWLEVFAVELANERKGLLG